MPASRIQANEGRDHHDRVAVVTGANKGIGRAIADRLAQLRMTVWVGARDPQRGADAAAAVGPRARFLALDVTDPESAAAAADTVERESGRLDVLVNNAGIGTRPYKPPSATSLADVRRVYEVNVFGVITVTNAMLPLLRRSPSARIVNVSTDLASLAHTAANDHPMGAFPTLLDYNTSKVALNAVTLTYANELRDERILVNLASPGFVATDLNEFEGFLTPEQGARIPVRMATLPDDGPTATFIGEDGTETGGAIPW
ncbi:MAG: SDR family NAD(P)-dependent oxidoreductase [Solirubrobacteraceae bacterium]